ncbi:MAG: aspartate/glutamate racemase family protein, partial [Gammaproteobacteria bacterium]|nr:aspartate/glutamate racemase family protein [Gammaproteobacteria bacterium]
MSTRPADSFTVDSPLEVDRQNMPYDLDEGLGAHGRIGLIVLATDQSIEHEFRKMLDIPGVAFYESRIYNSPEITPETLAEMEAGIADATRLIVPNIPLDVVAYACTSGAMVIGEANVHARIHEARPDVACTTPMEATIAALHALGAARVCLIAPYADEINRSMRRVIVESGFEVPVMGSWNITDDGKVARLSAETVRRAALELAAGADVDVVFVACTSIRLAESVESLERELGKPVISSNHATAWHCLRLAGYEDEVPGFGKLFRTPLAR